MKKIINLSSLLIFYFLMICSAQCGDGYLYADTKKKEFSQQTMVLKYDPRADLRFHRFTHGDIIYVYGTSTAGKSTLTTQLVNYLENYTLISTRDLKTKYMEKIIRKVCPTEYDHVSKFMDSDAVLLYLFKESYPTIGTSIPEDETHKIFENLEKIKMKEPLIKERYSPLEQLHFLFDHIFALSQENKNLIVDNLDIGDFLDYMSMYNVHSPLHFLLLYCPVTVLLERVVKRNDIAAKKDPLDKRSLMRPLETFVDIYSRAKGKSFIEEVSKKTFMETYQTAHSLSIAAKDKHPMCQLSWEELSSILDSNFGTDCTVKVDSKYPYSLFLNTSTESTKDMISKVYTRTRPNKALLMGW